MLALDIPTCRTIYHTLPKLKTTGGHIQFSGGNYELFDLAKDPFESNNLAESKPEELKRMIQGLISALEAHKAVYPIDEQGNSLRPRLPSLEN